MRASTESLRVGVSDSAVARERGVRANHQAIWVLGAFGFLFALFSGLQMARNQNGVDDFGPIYTGARLAFSHRLYDPQAQLQVQRETIGSGRPDYGVSRLPFYYVLLWPIGRLPFAAAENVWLALMIAAAIAFTRVYPTANRGLLTAVTAASLPLFAGTLGQRHDLALLLLIVAIAMRLRARGAMIAAGLVLALLAIKIHMFFLLPIPLLMRREWRMLGGLAAGGVALLGISFAAAGPHWVEDYRRWASTSIAMPGLLGMPNLHGALAGVAHSAGWEIGLSLLVIVGVVLAAWRNGFELAFSAGLLGSFLVSHHAYLHDCAVLIPGLVEIVTRRKRQPARPAVPPPRQPARPAVLRFVEIVRGYEWGLAVTLLTPFPYFLPPLLIHVREGVLPAVLIAATLAVLTLGENKA